MLTMMVLDGGRLLATYTVLKSAAREAALYAAKYPAATSGTLQTVAVQEGNAVLQTAKLTTSVSNSTWSYGTGSGSGIQSEATVQLSYQFDFTTPVLSVASPLTIAAKHSALVQ